MIVARTIAEARAALRDLPRPLGLVPTMGALHAGHLSLVEAAQARCARVAASVFVNPTQFGRGEDFEKYPRDEARDLRLLEEAGVVVVFAPTADEMYPEGFATCVHVGGALTESLEGASRPSHFDGVAVIVTKLLGVVQPDVLFLGQKDAQQLAVVRSFVGDLDLPVEVAGVPTLREPDGLAMSSRNVHLTADQRAVAPGFLPRAARRRRGGRQARRSRQGRRRGGHERPDSPPPVRPRRRRRGARTPALPDRLSRRCRRGHVRPRGRHGAALPPRGREPTASAPPASSTASRSPSLSATGRPRRFPAPTPPPHRHPQSARTPPRTRPHERKDHHGDRLRQRQAEGARARGPRPRHHRLHRVLEQRRRRHDQDHQRGQEGRAPDRPKRRHRHPVRPRRNRCPDDARVRARRRGGRAAGPRGGSACRPASTSTT